MTRSWIVFDRNSALFKSRKPHKYSNVFESVQVWCSMQNLLHICSVV